MLWVLNFILLVEEVGFTPVGMPGTVYRLTPLHQR
jgi:hypothetical protein